MRCALRHSWLVSAAVLLAAPGCPHDSDTKPKPKSPTVRVRSYTEATQVRAVAGLQPFVFTASARGLDRWDARTSKSLTLTADHGLPGDDVLAMALDRGRGWLWVATNGGLTRYDVEAGVFTGIPPAPTDALAELAKDVRALAPAGTGGVWIGSAEGLGYTDAAGDWKATEIEHPVTALARDRDGNLWIGTEANGLAVRRVDGTFASFAADPHCALRTVRFVVDTPEGGAFAVGEDAAGEQRVAIVHGDVHGDVCATFRASPNARWVSAARRRDEIIVMTQRRIYVLAAARRGARKLKRDGMRLVPLAPGTDTVRSRSPYVVQALEVRVPYGATSLAVVGDSLLIGTRDLGTAAIDPDNRRTAWLRRGELGGGGKSIDVECPSSTRCFVATGGHGLWRFDGATFTRIDAGDSHVLAVASGARGEVYALHRISDEARIRVARVDGPTWAELDGVEIATPGRAASVVFAQTSPRGMLWLGLSYLDEDGEERPYGVAEVDVGLGLVAYHHASFDETEQERGVLPIPIDVTDIAFHGRDEVWLASREGVVRIQGQQIRVYMESEGLVSELVRGIAVTSGGVVFAATGAGVGVYDGEHWSNPAPLRRSVNAIAVGADGRLWMATPRGVAAYDGARVRRLDKRRGLLEDWIADIDIDRFGRVWALGNEGISIVTP